MLKNWAMLLTALVAFQAMGLQLLCFCGHCPISQTWGIHADAEGQGEHSCCAEALDAQAAAQGVGQLSDGGPCCGDDHHLSNQDANVHDQPRACPEPAQLAADLDPGPWSRTGLPSPRELGADRWARGPPGAAPTAVLHFSQRRLI